MKYRHPREPKVWVWYICGGGNEYNDGVYCSGNGKGHLVVMAAVVLLPLLVHAKLGTHKYTPVPYHRLTSHCPNCVQNDAQ